MTGRPGSARSWRCGTGGLVSVPEQYLKQAGAPLWVSSTSQPTGHDVWVTGVHETDQDERVLPQDFRNRSLFLSSFFPREMDRGLRLAVAAFPATWRKLARRGERQTEFWGCQFSVLLPGVLRATPGPRSPPFFFDLPPIHATNPLIKPSPPNLSWVSATCN